MASSLYIMGMVFCIQVWITAYTYLTKRSIRHWLNH